MSRTFLDAGVLIAVRGQEAEATRALALLEDPERSFVASDFPHSIEFSGGAPPPFVIPL